MPGQEKGLDLGGGDTLGVKVEEVATDGNKPGQDYDIEKAPGMFFFITGKFSNLPSYLKKIKGLFTGG